MSKNPREHLRGTNNFDELSPKELTKDEFGRRLHNSILQKGWNQSELARRAGIGRDAVSTYVRGRSFPEPATLRKLARALSVEPEDLLPNAARSAIDEDMPALSIRQSPGDPSKMWLQVNQSVTSDQATRIMAILNESP